MNSEQGCRDKKHILLYMTSPLPIDTILQAPLFSFSHADNVWYAPWGMCNVWIVLHVCVPWKEWFHLAKNLLRIALLGGRW
jgi:hypothetical protein